MLFIPDSKWLNPLFWNSGFKNGLVSCISITFWRSSVFEITATGFKCKMSRCCWLTPGAVDCHVKTVKHIRHSITCWWPCSTLLYHNNNIDTHMANSIVRFLFRRLLLFFFKIPAQCYSVALCKDSAEIKHAFLYFNASSSPRLK